ncbi:MAG: cation:proton antiporter [Leptospira sp.]|nr:cation:proton antiporter [Leptospira sp.]
MPLIGKNLISFFVLLLVFILGTIALFWYGSNLNQLPNLTSIAENHTTFSGQKAESPTVQSEIGNIPTPDIKNLTFFQEFSFIFTNNSSSIISKTLIQIILIMFLARLMGVYFRKNNQPTVIGEILAGILIGPSLLGWMLPEFQSFLFSNDQVEILEILSNLGLILFMFIIGMDIDLSFMKKRIDSMLIISGSGFYFPFLIGLGFAIYLYPKQNFSGVPFHEFGIFIGILLSITAYPLLARILHEKGLSKTNLGSMAMTSSAAIELCVWSILGLTLAMIKSNSWISLSITLTFTFLYTLIMIFLVQPFLRRLSEIYVSRENLTKTAMAIVFVFLFTSAFLTELIGLHALVGAFFAGVIMPSDLKLKSLISDKIDYVALVFLLPLFFALTGLRTDLTIFNESQNWVILFLIISIAILSKFFGSGIASRFVGFGWKDSISLGVLMNTRGLVELIVLNIGFQLGIISIQLFTIFVIMTITTTLLTGPTISKVQDYFNKFNLPIQPLEAFKKILISFAQPSMGVALIRLADFLFGANKDKTQISAVHITPMENLTEDELHEYKTKTFADIETLMEDLEIKVEMVHKTTENITYEILNQAKISHSRFLLIGAAKALFTKNILGGRIRPILSYAPCNVGVLLDNGLNEIKKVLVLKKTNSTLGYEKMIHYLIREHGNKKIHIHPLSLFTTLRPEDFAGYQLVIIDIDLWKEREEFLEVEIQSLDASFLIVQFK